MSLQGCGFFKRSLQQLYGVWILEGLGRRTIAVEQPVRLQQPDGGWRQGSGWGQVTRIGQVPFTVVEGKKEFEDYARALLLKRLGHLLKCARVKTGLGLDLSLTTPECNVNKSVHLI